MKPGDIVADKKNRKALLTSPKRATVLPNGSWADVYNGIHLQEWTIDKKEGYVVRIGDPWFCSEPRFICSLTDILPELKTNTVDEMTDTLGLNLEQISQIATLWAKKQQFDMPTNTEEREQRILTNEKLMLIVTEVAEACEALRKLDKENFEEELADVIIRTCNLAGSLGINLDEVVSEKMKKNRNRPKKHNKDC